MNLNQLQYFVTLAHKEHYIKAAEELAITQPSLSHAIHLLEEELNTIVDLGGCVDNVMIHHRVYGKMEAELALSSRRKVGAFMEDIRSGKSSPLKNITSNYHYHKVSADSEETLDLIEQELREKGFLVEERRQAV